MSKSLNHTVRWALATTMVLGTTAMAMAQANTRRELRRALQFLTEEDQLLPNAQAEPAAPLPKHWIGVSLGEVSPALRSHLSLAERQGVIVLQVVPDSPAAAAGLKVHDVLLEADGVPLSSTQDLLKVIRENPDGQLELAIIHAGQAKNVLVTPQERPQQIPVVPGPFLEGADAAGLNDLRAWMDQLQENALNQQPLGGLRLRALGPGMFLDGRMLDLNDLPGGVSVSVAKQDDGPAKVTVRRGEQTWEFDAEDKEAINELPEELREMVGQMLGRSPAAGFRFDFDNDGGLEALPRLRELGVRPGPRLQRGEVMDRFQQMEKRMEELRREIRRLRAEEEQDADKAAQDAPGE